MVTKLNWELIQEKLSGALAEPAARGVVRDELAALEEKLKAYVLSPEMASDLDGLKAVYLEKLVAGCETVLAENLPDWLERALSQDDVWQMARDEVLPAIRVFLLHQIKRNREALVAGLKLSDRIEKAILDQKPEV